MKRTGTIFIAFILALTVVYLGGGAVVVECLRSNTIEVAFGMSDCCDDGNDDECSDGGQCMKTTVVKLQPTVVCKQLNDIQKPLLAPLTLFDGIGASCALQARTMHGTVRTVAAPHSPPRRYLALIRVLII